MLKNTPKQTLISQDIMEVIKDSQYKDIENCVRLTYSIFPESTSRTIATLRDILEGTYESWNKVPDSEILRKVQYPAVDSVSCAQIRAKINTEALILAFSLPNGQRKDAILNEIDEEFIALHVLQKFFSEPDSPKVQ